MNLCVVCHVDISHRRSNARYCSRKCQRSKPANIERTCAICGDDITHRPLTAKFCSDECARSAVRRRAQEARADPEKRAQAKQYQRNRNVRIKEESPAVMVKCKTCGETKPRAKFRGRECNTCLNRRGKARLKERKRTDPSFAEKEKQSNNARQNTKYKEDDEFREGRIADSKDYRERNLEAVRARDRASYRKNIRNAEWVNKQRARRRTPQYHETRNTRNKVRRATEPDLSRAERGRLERLIVEHPECRATALANHKQWYQSSETYRATNRDYDRKCKYGLPPGEYTRKSLEQRCVCAICGGDTPSGRNLDVDHRHAFGLVRGLLCGLCNRGLGKLEENLQRLLAAIDHLNAPLWTPNSIPRLTQDEIHSSSSASRKKLVSRAFKLKSRDAELMNNYGIVTDQYRWLWVEGKGVCWICRKPETSQIGRSGRRRGRSSALNVDHDNGTGDIRGLLCFNCNTGIGLFKHDVEILKTAAGYLVQWNGGSVQPKLLDKLAHGP